MGLSIDDVRTAIVSANALSPLGIIEGAKQAIAIESNAQLAHESRTTRRSSSRPSNGDVVRLSEVAEVRQATRNSRSAAMFNNQPAILLTITKSADANVIDTVDRIHALLPEIKRWIPEGIDISVLSDRTTTLRASVHDMQLTLGLSIALVMLVVYLFLRRPTPTIAAGITVPLSLAGTCAAHVGGRVLGQQSHPDGAGGFRRLRGRRRHRHDREHVPQPGARHASPLRAALEGARQIGFTVISISVSLVAAFIPLLFMDGIVGPPAAGVLRHAGVRHCRVDGGFAHRDADDLRPLRARRPQPRRHAARPRRSKA